MDSFKTKLVSCKPISSLDELFSWSKETEDATSRKYRTQNLRQFKSDLTKNQMIVCHDMRNNYLSDRYFQGFNNARDYTFYHWDLIDIFIYFSHHFITIPPESWINAAHENNVRTLGTFITEWKDGYEICKHFLKDKNTIDKCVKKLVDITVCYGFDGWLINIENNIDDSANLIYFVKKLTEALRKIDSDLYKVIWYDSVINTGELKWQNELNELNESFFNVCDGIFVNYTWKDENLAKCMTYSERIRDIYIGVDIFGRGVYGGGGFNTNMALNKINEYNLSCALFAPGWVLECNDENKFIEANQKFWGLLRDETKKRTISNLPVVSTFTHSRGEMFFTGGSLISSSEWCNFNLQGLMPSFYKSDSEKLSWYFNDAFYGGSCLLIKSSKNDLNLFELDIDVKEKTLLKLEFSFKINDFNSNNSDNTFELSFNYCLSNNPDKICRFNSSKENNDFIELIGSFEKTNKFNWHSQVILMRAIENIQLTSLVALNNTEQQDVKLGLLRLLELKEDTTQPCLTPTHDLEANQKNFKIFKLNNKNHISVVLNWNRKCSEIKYYNLFIKTSLDKCIANEEATISPKPCYKYIGSSSLEEFRLCLRLNENITINSSQQTSKFFVFVYIQPVKVDLDGCSLHENEFETNDCIQRVNVQLGKLGTKDELNFDFIDEIVYDLELF